MRSASEQPATEPKVQGAGAFFGLLGTLPASTTLFDMLGAIGVTSLLGGTFAPASVAIAKRAEIEAGGGADLGPTGWRTR